MGNDMFNDEQLAHAEIVQKDTEDALTWWKSRALLAAEPATERETRLEAAYQREHARLTEVLGALSEVLPPGAEIRPAMLALKARAEAAEPAKGADMSRAEGALAAEVRAALNVANGRWYEWGERAESVEEILLAGLRGYERAATAEPAQPAGAEVARLTALLRECNAVCLCGCPESEHESYGEDGESCADEGHECIRVAPAVLEIVQRYRVALAGTPAPRPAQDAVREAAELAHLDLLSYDEAVTGNEKRHALSRCKNALRDVLRTIDAALDAANGPK